MQISARSEISEIDSLLLGVFLMLTIRVILLSFSKSIAEEALHIPLLYGVLVVPASAMLAGFYRTRLASQSETP